MGPFEKGRERVGTQGRRAPPEKKVRGVGGRRRSRYGIKARERDKKATNRLLSSSLVQDCVNDWGWQCVGVGDDGERGRGVDKVGRGCGWWVDVLYLRRVHGQGLTGPSDNEACA